MHRPTCLLLLVVANSFAYATPRDWCVRPEASEYRALDLKPGSGVRTVLYPSGIGYGANRLTYSLSADGLLRSIRREFPQQDCLESFVRDNTGTLLARATTCSPRPASSKPTTYRYIRGGWSETNDKGTETTTVEPVSEFGAAWRVRTHNVDRAWPTPPGSFVETHFDDTCREVGPQWFMEMRVAIGGPVPGPTINLVRSITPRESGYDRTTMEGSQLKEIVTIGDHGFVLAEQFFDRSSDRLPFAVQETSYKLDTRRNWTSRTSTHRNLRERGPATQDAVVRELSYQ